MTSAIDDDDTRRNARIGVDMLDRLLKAIRVHMETGKIAEASLAEIRQRKTFLSRR